MDSANKIAVLARQFDDLSRGFSNLIEGKHIQVGVESLFSLHFCTSDFKRHAVYQDDCRAKWHEAEEEIRHLRNQLSDMNQLNSKLEAQCHQTTLLLKNEVKVRTHLQEEKKTLVSY